MTTDTVVDHNQLAIVPYRQLAIVPYRGGRSIFSVDDNHFNDDLRAKAEVGIATFAAVPKAEDSLCSNIKDKFAGDEVPYTRRPKGTTTLAFICKDGVMVAIC
ncbi:OLC1v1006277C1 [Oldenlandia corymbosa var. corymbosa]|uniref:OLC1v1006277C1 n=1 Tax=Oldenlandia corymbosa var. corymbosa TaxID=529605 RepID=A0AAV1DJM0_OLDCO|nr:OLC1v1006277C1 [Oldenlandia corymbosa var. corymbosa]